MTGANGPQWRVSGPIPGVPWQRVLLIPVRLWALLARNRPRKSVWRSW